MPKINRALLSVSDKAGIVDLAVALHAAGVEILSTGGTAETLTASGIPVVQVSDFTGQPEMLGGRVKTLNPRIHGGILARRKSSVHRREMARHHLLPIDLAVVNLYPFEATVARPGATFAEAIENIDIGGPAMLRSAAKNFEDVTVIVDPADYPALIKEMRENRNRVSAATNFALARKAFSHTSSYDAVILSYLESHPQGAKPAQQMERLPFPDTLCLPLSKVQDLRYGENPHQAAAVYREPSPNPGLATAKQLSGKELSFNNYLDLDAAWTAARDFLGRPFVVIIKHTNPCGAARARNVALAFELARATDPVSAYGGVIGVSRQVSAALAEKITTSFFEAVIAPGYAPRALEILGSRKNLRLMEVTAATGRMLRDMKKIDGGYLLQDPDLPQIRDIRKLPVVTRRKPTVREYRALEFAWKMVRHVKSNAIIFANEEQLVGIGAGQMSRVDSCRLAGTKAVLPLRGTTAASDAFFPFRDGVDLLAAAGATAVIQPGGSIRDEEVIQAADEQGLAMVFTGYRHFKH